MTCDSREFFKRLLRELERRNISPADLQTQPIHPESPPTSVRFKVPRAALQQLGQIQIEVARQCNWVLAGVRENSTKSLRTILANLESPGEWLELNVFAEGATSDSVPNNHGRGICLALLGSDGAGKSTLLARSQEMLKPCFPEQRTIHFRPAIFEKPKTGVVTEPHGRPPRNLVSSWLKIIYYFFDNWIGWFAIVRPAKRRGGLVIFDRCFDDILIDTKRYRLQGVSTLVRILSSVIPRADRTIVLVASAEVLHRRKLELPVAELERQQRELRQLAANGKNMVVVSAEPSPEQVALAAWREIILSLAEREKKFI